MTVLCAGPTIFNFAQIFLQMSFFAKVFLEREKFLEKFKNLRKIYEKNFMKMQIRFNEKKVICASLSL